VEKLMQEIATAFRTTFPTFGAPNLRFKRLIIDAVRCRATVTNA